MARASLVCLALVAGCFDLDRLRAPSDGSAPPDGGGPSLCAGLGVQLCDGFEGALLDPRWTTVVHSGGVSLDAFPFRGARSLALHGDAAASGDVQAEITENDTFPASQIFMRAFVFLPTSTPVTPIRLMTAYQPSAPYTGVSLYVKPTSGGFAPRIYDGIANMTHDTSASSFAAGQWVCLEWQVVQGNPGSVRVWVDDTEVPDLSLSFDTSTSPPFGVLSFGLLHPAGTSAHDLWFDEVAVGTARITCAN